MTQTIRESKTVWLIVDGLLLAIIGLALTLTAIGISNKVPHRPIYGTVTAVDYKMNIAEDGHYSFSGTDTNNQAFHIYVSKYYFNVPLFPEDNGEKCVKIPIVKTGQTVEFNLPQSTVRAGDYYNCFPIDKNGYYFNVN